MHSWTWPATGDVMSACSLVRCELDAPLSEKGVEQANRAASQYHSEFDFPPPDIALVAQSPLQRAQKTCEKIVLAHLDRARVRVETREDLRERTPLEYLRDAPFDARVASFKAWLAEQPEQVVCVVGHGQYFRRLLGVGWKLQNVDVFRVAFDPATRELGEPQRVCRSALADPAEART